MKNIECISNPKSIAVAGATNRAGSVGLATFKNLMQPTSVMRLPFGTFLWIKMWTEPL